MCLYKEEKGMVRGCNAYKNFMISVIFEHVLDAYPLDFKRTKLNLYCKF